MTILIIVIIIIIIIISSSSTTTTTVRKWPQMSRAAPTRALFSPERLVRAPRGRPPSRRRPNGRLLFTEVIRYYYGV